MASFQKARSKGAATSVLRRWPAVTASMTVSLLGYASLFYMAAIGFPGDAASNCFEDYLVTPDCYCEKPRGDKPGDAWFAQPMNTATNLFFVLAGLVIAYAADTKSFPSKHVWQHNYNYITQDSSFSVVYAINACLLGIGSSFLHAAFTTWGRKLDMMAMYLIATYGFFYPMLKRDMINKEQAVWLYISSNAGLFYWTAQVATPDQTRKLFTTIIVISWVAEFLFGTNETSGRNAKSRRLFILNMLAFLVGAAIWKLSESSAPLCNPESFWQGHSWWHFQSAVGIAGQYFCFLYDEGKPPAPDHEKCAEREEAFDTESMHSESASQETESEEWTTSCE